MDAWRNQRPKEHSVPIAGFRVPFPHARPFPQQCALMNAAFRAMRSSENALLESPTGTGKTLALLASTLTWQKETYREAVMRRKEAKARQMLAEKEKSSISKKTAKQKLQVSDAKIKHSKIFFTARTHSQISQTLNELKRCPRKLLEGLREMPSTSAPADEDDFEDDDDQNLGGDTSSETSPSKLRLTVLGSRKQYCINSKVRRGGDAHVNEGCEKASVERTKARFVQKALWRWRFGSQRHVLVLLETGRVEEAAQTCARMGCGRNGHHGQKGEGVPVLCQSRLAQ